MVKIRKEWIGSDSCDKCGDDLYIMTSCREGGLVFDGDEAYCHKCGLVGTVVQEEEDGISWINPLD